MSFCFRLTLGIALPPSTHIQFERTRGHAAILPGRSYPYVHICTFGVDASVVENYETPRALPLWLWRQPINAHPLRKSAPSISSTLSSPLPHHSLSTSHSHCLHSLRSYSLHSPLPLPPAGIQVRGGPLHRRALFSRVRGPAQPAGRLCAHWGRRLGPAGLTHAGQVESGRNAGA